MMLCQGVGEKFNFRKRTVPDFPGWSENVSDKNSYFFKSFDNFRVSRLSETKKEEEKTTDVYLNNQKNKDYF